MLQPSLQTTGDICRPALYGIYLLEATANQLTSRSRRRRKMLAKAQTQNGEMKMKMETGRIGRQSQVATTKEPRQTDRERERLYKVVMCRMRLVFWRRFGFDAVFHSFAYGYGMYVCV